MEYHSYCSPVSTGAEKVFVWKVEGGEVLVQWPIGLVEKQIRCRRERGVHVHTLHVVHKRGDEKEEVK